MIRRVLLGLIVTCYPILSLAAEVNPNGPNITASLIQVCGALLLIVSLIFGAAWLAKKINIVGGSGYMAMKAISALPLGRKEKAVLIEASGKKMLLGVASGSVTLLHVFDDDTADDKNYPDLHNEAVEKSIAIKSVKEEREGPAFSTFLTSLLAPTGRNDEK